MTAPISGTVLLRNATVPASVLRDTPAGRDLVRLDIRIEDGRIAALLPAGGALPPGIAVHDMDNGLVLPAFVDMHTHIDKGHIAPRQPNPDGTFGSALTAVQLDREARWSATDVAVPIESIRPPVVEPSLAIVMNSSPGRPSS